MLFWSLKLTNMKKGFLFYLLTILLIVFILNSCKKEIDNIDQPRSIQNTQLIENFLKVPATAPSVVKRIAEEFRNQDKIRPGFIAEFASKNGSVLWGQAEISFRDKTMFRNGFAAEGDTTVLLPFSTIADSSLTGFIQAEVYDSVKLFMYNANDYGTLPSSQDYNDTVFTQQKFALVMMQLQKEVTGDSLFAMTDTTLFQQSGQAVTKVKINEVNKAMATIVTPSWCFAVTFQIMPFVDINIWLCFPFGDGSNLPNYPPYNHGSGGTGSGTGGTGSPTGDTGGSPTGDPCMGRQIVDGNLPSGCGGGPVGWEPIEANEPVTLVDSNAGDPPVDIVKIFNCFNLLPDAGATYSVKLCVDIPVNGNPNWPIASVGDVGHTFLTVTKTNGSNSIT